LQFITLIFENKKLLNLNYKNIMKMFEILETLEREGIKITSAAFIHRLKTNYNITNPNRGKKVIVSSETISNEIIEYYRLKCLNKKPVGDKNKPTKSKK